MSLLKLFRTFLDIYIYNVDISAINNTLSKQMLLKDFCTFYLK